MGNGGLKTPKVLQPTLVTRVAELFVSTLIRHNLGHPESDERIQTDYTCDGERISIYFVRMKNDAISLRRKFSDLWPLLDERSRRLMAANEARSLGYGGISSVRRACGLSRKAIAKRNTFHGDWNYTIHPSAPCSS